MRFRSRQITDLPLVAFCHLAESPLRFEGEGFNCAS